MQKSSVEKSINGIKENLKDINLQSRNYIKDVLILINKEIGINKILSIILFGSQRGNSETSAVSDCDLLIIFKDRVSNHHIKEIEKYFLALEIKHKFREFNTKLTRKILGVIQQTTGIFVSHFLTKRKYWEAANFYKIFRVNRVFSALFAPRNIVLGNILTNSSILYGNDLRSRLKPKIQITFIEMIKSTVMNLMISFFSIVISIFRKLNPEKYQLEAIKWALNASNFYCFRDSKTLKKTIDRFVSFEKPKFQKHARKFFNNFLDLRINPRNDMNFMVRCPARIIKIHIKAILYKKLIHEKLSSKTRHTKSSLNVPVRIFPLRI